MQKGMYVSVFILSLYGECVGMCVIVFLVVLCLSNIEKCSHIGMDFYEAFLVVEVSLDYASFDKKIKILKNVFFKIFLLKIINKLTR